MDEFWRFASDHWWLAFPLAGMIGTGVAGAYKAWERDAKRRHERRLELLRLKAEVKAARGGGVRPAIAPSTDLDSAEDSTSRLQRALGAHDDLTHRWLEYELDVAKLIAFPAMSDGRQPLTAAFLRAKKVADGLRPPSATAKVGAADLAAYREAVTDAEVAFDIAEQDARRQRDRSFSDAERRRLDTAKRLLNIAIDEAASPAERRAAYERVRAELDGLIAVSDEAMTRLAERAALQLPPSAAP